MQFATSALLTLAASAIAVSAAAVPVTRGSQIRGPLAKRAAEGQEDIDVVILNYALTLEHLENAFYR